MRLLKMRWAERYERARRAAAVVAGRQVSIPVATRWAVDSGRTDDIGDALVDSSWVRKSVHVWRGGHEAEGDLGHAPFRMGPHHRARHPDTACHQHQVT